MVTYRCGHKRPWNPGLDIQSRALCWDCRTALIGQRVEFVRYGRVPEGERSWNYAEGRQEQGVSCYLIIDGEIAGTVRSEFSNGRRPVYGTGVLVGFGGDDEPLVVDIVTHRKCRKN